MIALRLAIKSILRTPKPNFAAMIALVSVLVPIMILWSMKVGFIQSMMDELRSSPASLEVRVKGDYLLTPEKLSQISGLRGVGFVMPTARYLASRAFANKNNGRNRTAVSLLPTASGDPLIPDLANDVDETHAVISRHLANSVQLDVGDAFEIANARRDQSEHLRITVSVSGIADLSGISGNWVFVHPSIIADVEAFLDGYALPHRGEPGKALASRPDIFSGLRLYANRIENVIPLARAMEDLDITVESNAARIEVIQRLDAILSRIVAGLSVLLCVGLMVSAWSWLIVQLDRLRQHVALLGLMGHSQLGVGLYFVFIGLFNALGGLMIADLVTRVIMKLGNSQFSAFLPRGADIFVLPFQHLAAINSTVLGLQLLLAATIAIKSSKIRPGELFRDH